MVPTSSAETASSHRCKLKVCALNGCALRIYGDIELGGVGIGETLAEVGLQLYGVTSLEREHVGGRFEVVDIGPHKFHLGVAHQAQMPLRGLLQMHEHGLGARHQLAGQGDGGHGLPFGNVEGAGRGGEIHPFFGSGEGDGHVDILLYGMKGFDGHIHGGTFGVGQTVFIGGDTYRHTLVLLFVGARKHGDRGHEEKQQGCYLFHVMMRILVNEYLILGVKGVKGVSTRSAR